MGRLNDLVKASIEAYRLLGTDGLIDILVPKQKNDFRIVDAGSYAKSSNGQSLEATLRPIEEMSDDGKIAADFNPEDEYDTFKNISYRLRRYGIYDRAAGRGSKAQLV